MYNMVMIRRFKCLILGCVVLVAVNILMLGYLEHGSRRWYGRAAMDRVVGARPRQPLSSAVPNIAYTVIWNSTYTFQNYLSLLSVVRHLQPYRVYIFVDGPPHNLTAGEPRWYRRLVDTLPNIEVIGLHNHSGAAGTSADGREYRTRAAVAVLRRFGGIYVESNTIITSSLDKFRQSEFHVGLTRRGVVSYMTAAPGVASVDRVQLVAGLGADHAGYATVSRCTALGYQSTIDQTNDCVTFTKEKIKQPSDIMYKKSSLAALCRSLMYRQTLPFTADRRLAPIPNIVHYVWLGDSAITYSMLLCFLSTVKFVRPDKVFIYVSKVPSGGYWNAVTAHPNVSFVIYGPVTSVYGTRLRYIQHVSDVIRSDVLLRYGGIYVDWDILWIKPVGKLLETGYETIVSPDRPPKTLNMGIAFSQPGSRFMELWQASFHSYTGDHTTWHAVDVPYMIYEDHPASVYIERNLQLQCYRLVCRGGAERRGIDALTPYYALHLSQGSPVAFTSERILRMSTGMFATIGKNILD